MKRIVSIFAIAFALVTAQLASAQSSVRPHVSAVGYTSSAYLNCNVNGVIYPVDSAFNVWAWNGYSWFIIGRLVITSGGYIVVRTDGAMFAASCY